MRILIIGANGRVGRLVVAQALADGHEVTAFMRSARALPAHPNLTVVLGSVVEEPKRVREVMVRHDAVISGLGNPLWLAGKRGPAIVADSMRNVVDAMSEVGMGRIVVPLAWGTGASRSHVSPLVRVVATTLIRRDFRDFGAAEEMIASSGLEWTIAYFGFLTDDPAGSAWSASAELCTPANLAVSRADLAEFLVVSATEGIFVKERAVISGPKIKRGTA